jgi:hypothetical protein
MRVYSWLRYELNFKTHRGFYLSVGNVFKIINNTFYYGRFEFPQGSGNWYDGKHEPIITKELFDDVRASLKTQVIKSHGKEFAFTRMVKCGACGSGITADEKFKKLQNGGVNRHVYYRCTKSKDRKCTNPAVNEVGLLKEFQKMASTLDLNEVQLTEKLNLEIKKFKKLQAMFLGKENAAEIQKVDLRNYTKFVLRDGTVLEKRSVLNCIKNNLILKNRSISIQK